MPEDKTSAEKAAEEQLRATGGGDKLPSGEDPLGERDPAMEGDEAHEPKTDKEGRPQTPGAGQSSAG